MPKTRAASLPSGRKHTAADIDSRFQLKWWREDRRLALRRPGGPHRGEEAEPALVLEDDPGAPGPGVFFTLGQRSLTHARWPRRRARRPAGRALAAPAHLAQHPPDVPGVVLHPGHLLDHLGHPGERPQLGREAVGLGSLLQGPGHLGQVGLAHLGRTTRLAGSLQCLLAADRPLLVPGRCCSGRLSSDMRILSDI